MDISRSITIKDLCPEEKRRIAQLVLEIAHITEERERERAELDSVREELRQCRDAAAREKCELERQLLDAQRRIETHQSQLAALLEARNTQCSRATSPRSLSTVDTQDSGTLFLIPKLLEDVARTRDEIRSTTSRPMDAQYAQRGVPVVSDAAHLAVQPVPTSARSLRPQNADASSAPKKRSPKRPMAAPVLLDLQSGPPLETDSNRLGAGASGALESAARRPSLSVLELIDLLDEPAPPPSRTQPTRATAFSPVPAAASAPVQRLQHLPSLCRKALRAGRLSRYELPSALALRSHPATSRPRASAYGDRTPLASSRAPRGRDMVDGVWELFVGRADDEDDEKPESGRRLIEDTSIETREMENCTDSFPLVTCPVDGIEPAECSASFSCDHEDRCASCAEQQQFLAENLFAPTAGHTSRAAAGIGASRARSVPYLCDRPARASFEGQPPETHSAETRALRDLFFL